METERRRTGSTKRGRSTTRSTQVSTSVVPRFWPRALVAPLASFANPPRQLWLLALGGAALTVRKSTELYAQLVEEGAAVERSLRVPDLSALIQRGAPRPPNGRPATDRPPD